MRTVCFALLFAGATHAAEFHTGQAARAVIGQASFSARDSGVSAHALSLVHGRLNAAEDNRLLTFDVSKPCTLCGFAPVSVLNLSVLRGVSAVAVFGKTVIAADNANHRVLIWRSTMPSPGAIGPKQPDAILSTPEPLSVAYDGHRLFVGDAALHGVLVWNALPNADNQPADAVLGQADDVPDAASIGIPAALVSDGANLFVSDTENRRILIFSPGDIGIAADAIVNSASLFSEAFAPGTLITIRTAGLADSAEAAAPSSTDALPTTLAKVEVFLNGSALPLLAVSPEEVQAQLPYNLGAATSGSLYLRAARDNGSLIISSAAAVRFAPASPGIFAVGEREPRSGLLLHTGNNAEVDGSAAKGAPITTENPATPGEIVTVWASGLGLVGGGDIQAVIAGLPSDAADTETVLPVRALVNGEPAEVLSARLPHGVVGVYEVLVALPAGLPASENIRLQLVQNAFISNTVIFSVQTPQ